jgi:hypothetical protein
MTYLNKQFRPITLPPTEGLPQPWLSWLNDLHRRVKNSGALSNDHTVLNPDFHWYGTTITSDGQACNPWAITSNGATFTSTPTAYTSTNNNADTGSKQYINLAITAGTGGNFEFHQQADNKLSRYQNKRVTLSSKVTNNNSDPVKAHFYVGVDTNASGTDDHVQTSGTFDLASGLNVPTASFDIPRIETDNQNNKVNIKLILENVTQPSDLDLHYIKDEFSSSPTVLNVDHSLEKYRIDNP